MPSMNDLVRAHTTLDAGDLEWLHLIVADWQMLADLSFADLVLWVPTADETRYVAVAQMRPNTGTTWSDTWYHAANDPCSTRPWTRAGSSARATRSGARRCRCGSRRSRCGGRT